MICENKQKHTYQFMFSDSAEFFKIHRATVAHSTGLCASSQHFKRNINQLSIIFTYISSEGYSIYLERFQLTYINRFQGNWIR